MGTCHQALGQWASSPWAHASTAVTVLKASTAGRQTTSQSAVVMVALVPTHAVTLEAVSCSHALLVRCACKPCNFSLTLSRMTQRQILWPTSSGASVLGQGAVLWSVSLLQQQWLPVLQETWAAVLVPCAGQCLSVHHRHLSAGSSLAVRHNSSWTTAPLQELLMVFWNVRLQAQGLNAAARLPLTAQDLEPSVAWPLRPVCAAAPTTLALSPAGCLVSVRRLHAKSAATVLLSGNLTLLLPQPMPQKWRDCSGQAAAEGTQKPSANHLLGSSPAATGATLGAVLVPSAACWVGAGHKYSGLSKPHHLACMQQLCMPRMMQPCSDCPTLPTQWCPALGFPAGKCAGAVLTDSICSISTPELTGRLDLCTMEGVTTGNRNLPDVFTGAETGGGIW